MINYDEVNYKIKAVFDAFNGRVNMIKPANLIIDWIDLRDSTRAGSSNIAGDVKIYPMVIHKYNNYKVDTIFYYTLALTIIHELYHVDQFIIRSKLLDPEYVKMVESTVEIQSISYLCCHTNEICNLLNIKAEYLSCNNYLSRYMTNYLYQRTNKDLHFYSAMDCILQYTGELRTLDTIMEYYYNPKKNIIININGLVFDVSALYKFNNSYMQNINTYLKNTVLASEYISNRSCNIFIRDEFIEINIELKNINMMVKPY